MWFLKNDESKNIQKYKQSNNLKKLRKLLNSKDEIIAIESMVALDEIGTNESLACLVKEMTTQNYDFFKDIKIKKNENLINQFYRLLADKNVQYAKIIINQVIYDLKFIKSVTDINASGTILIVWGRIENCSNCLLKLDKSSVNDLIDCLKDDDKDVRYFAAKLMRDINDEKSEHSWRSILDQKDISIWYSKKFDISQLKNYLASKDTYETPLLCTHCEMLNQGKGMAKDYVLGMTEKFLYIHCHLDTLNHDKGLILDLPISSIKDISTENFRELNISYRVENQSNIIENKDITLFLNELNISFNKLSHIDDTHIFEKIVEIFNTIKSNALSDSDLFKLSLCKKIGIYVHHKNNKDNRCFG